MSTSSTASAAVSSTLSASTSLAASTSGAASSTTLAASTTTSSNAPATTTDNIFGGAQTSNGITLLAFLAALVVSIIVFAVQTGIFFLLRNKLSRIFKPKTYLVPERERTESPPVSPWGMVFAVMRFRDWEIIKKCGLDAYFFLRYLQTLLVIFIPIALVVIPILVPMNYVGGIGQSIVSNDTSNSTNSKVPSGLDTLAWGNVAPKNVKRRWAHLVLAVLVVLWVCYVFFAELRVYVKVRQDYLTSAEHRLRASANTVLVSSIPEKWLSEDALRGLFDVFPGGIRNIWLTRDLTPLLDKIKQRDAVHQLLESAETELVKLAAAKYRKVKRAEAKKSRRMSRVRNETKSEKAQREKAEDEEARRRAEGVGGITSGQHEEVPHDIDEAVEEAGDYDTNQVEHPGRDMDQDKETGLLGKVPLIGGGLIKVGQGMKKGVGVVGGAGQGIVHGVDGQLTRTGGFELMTDQSAPPPTGGSDRRRVQVVDDDKPKTSFASEAPTNLTYATSRGHAYAHSQDSVLPKPTADLRNLGNTTRKATNLDEMFITEETRWWEFWKPPAGGYASPIPQAAEGGEFPFTKPEKSVWQKVKGALPFFGDQEPPKEYPAAFTRDYLQEKEDQPEWQKWVKPKDRPTHRLPNFSFTPSWLPGLPLINKKVDTIYWCRGELARLNLEIEEDQKHPERYPVMTSAFIQFNNQVAAHMACQAVTHHVPKQMAPRIVEISPNDVIWDNMAIKWWEGWIRSVVVMAIVLAMIALWFVPVAWTASLSNLDSLIKTLPWLSFLTSNDIIHRVANAIAGVLPAVVLAILLAIVPVIFDFLAGLQGAKTGSQKSELVQVYYFLFLFFQVFLVVSITGTAWSALSSFSDDIGAKISSLPQVLGNNLPNAADYFFSYMILQALSVSSGTLLQIGTLFVWYILSRIVDSTARAKWTRNVTLPSVTWGSYFPVYTNFACIALIYSVIAPIISIFAIITFSLLWVANRYNMLYVTRFKNDTGGVLFPRAINQTFTGLYVMELCLIGLFFSSVDENGNLASFPQGIIMVVVMILTITYQFMLNRSFGPLFRYLPITFEDEAVIRDEIFQKAQNKRLGLADDDEDDEATTLRDAVDGTGHRSKDDGGIEMQKMQRKDRTDTGTSFRLGNFKPVKGIVTAGGWAVRGGNKIRQQTLGKAEANLRTVNAYRVRQRQKDLEAQRAIGEALYGGISDEIEDLTPEERDVLVRKAFQHYALRARRPIVWIPRDEIGVSDDEVLRTKDFSEHIWISNEHTALDSKLRVLYGRAPPDFSEVDLIDL
ncbi:DUF221-domain-containing protein [Thozetella sp. PMI_491]|nr:DUF221-domain-containing protein [Thozetella sp. PMI_491]